MTDPGQGSPEWLEIERHIQRRLVEEFEKLMRGPRVRPTALIVHPSATQEDIDEAIAYYAEKP